MTILRCQCCGEALLPTARALICAACHHSANIRHCRVFCTLHDQEIDPTLRAPLSATSYVGTGAAVMLTTTTKLDRATVDAIRAEWHERVGQGRPLTFHTREDIHTHRDLAECVVCRDA